MRITGPQNVSEDYRPSPEVVRGVDDVAGGPVVPTSVFSSVVVVVVVVVGVGVAARAGAEVITTVATAVAVS